MVAYELALEKDVTVYRLHEGSFLEARRIPSRTAFKVGTELLAGKQSMSGRLALPLPDRPGMFVLVRELSERLCELDKLWHKVRTKAVEHQILMIVEILAMKKK